MTSPIFVDTNIPIYALGRGHPLRSPARHVLTLAESHATAFVTDAEVLQELLHRYMALHLWEQGSQVFRNFFDLMQDRIEPIYPSDVDTAAHLADRYPGLSARDLVHAAVMHRLGISRIVSADTGFDRIEEVERLDPAQVEEWAGGLG